MKIALFLTCLLFLLLFLVFPLGYILSQSFFINGGFSFAIFTTLVSNHLIRESVFNSFLLAALVVALTSCIGIPLSLLFFRRRFPGKTVFRTLFFLPLILSPFVGAIGMRQILSRFGSLNLILMKLGIMHDPVSWLGSGFWGIVILETLHLFPIMFLNISAALNNFDTSLEEASRNLGAGRLSTFRRVTFPLLMPGYFAAVSIIFIWALTDLGTPLVFEFQRLISVQIYNSLSDINVNPSGYALVVTVVLLTLFLFVFTRQYIQRTSYTTQRTQLRSEERPVSAMGLVGVYSFLSLLLFASLLPHVGIILTSLSEKWFFSVLPQEYSARYYGIVFTHGLTETGMLNSIFYSTLSTVVDILLGFSIGFILARTNIRGRVILDILSMIPLAIPGIIIAFAYLTSFAGTFLDARTSPVLLLIMSYSIRRLPYLVRSTYSSFQQIGEHLEEASYNLGASRYYTLRKITLPLISPGLFAGGIMVFAFSVLEVGSSLILAIKEQYFPISKVIYTLAGRVTDGPYVASALGVLGMILVGISIAVSSKLVSRRIGEFFRIG